MTTYEQRIGELEAEGMTTSDAQSVADAEVLEPTPFPEPMNRDEAISRIRAGLRKRTGRAWSVTGGRGTAWGWIRIHALPAHRQDGYYLSDADRRTLAEALGLETVHHQGESIPASSDYWREYVDRAEGRTPTVHGKQYWD